MIVDTTACESLATACESLATACESLATACDVLALAGGASTSARQNELQRIHLPALAGSPM